MALHICVCVRQSAARGHRAYTDLSATRVWGQSYMHSLQPRQLGNDSLLNNASYTPSWAMRGGASRDKPLEIPGGFEVAPVIGVSGMATTVEFGRNRRNTPCLRGGSNWQPGD